MYNVEKIASIYNVLCTRLFPTFTDPWLQIELPDLVNMKRVAVQGRAGSDGTDWVETFSLAYRTNETDWTYYEDTDGSVKVGYPIKKK